MHLRRTVHTNALRANGDAWCIEQRDPRPEAHSQSVFKVAHLAAEA